MTHESLTQLWEGLKIKLSIDENEFPYDHICGRIEISPAHGRRCIEKLQLIVDSDEKCAIDINVQIDTFYASGFANQAKRRHLQIKALPIKLCENSTKKISNTCDFEIKNGQFIVFPKLEFELLIENTTKKKIPVLHIRWRHLGDESAQKYLIFLDDKQIHQVGLDCIKDEHDVRLFNLEPGNQYVIQIAAFLNNRKETYRSERLTFAVPKDVLEMKKTEVVCISHNIMPFVASAMAIKLLEKKKKDKPIKRLCPCGLPLPHDSFPGVDHYFRFMDSEQ